jgi:phosphoenolpyruvate-protein phosphotransferase (PTS system enzyme I)
MEGNGWRDGRLFRGLGVSPGLVLGRVELFGDGFEVGDDLIPELGGGSEGEWELLEKALELTREQLLALQERLTKAGSQDAEIFDAHLLMLEDRSVLREVNQLISEFALPAGVAYYRVMQRYMSALERVEDSYLRERVADIRDVAKRVLQNLKQVRRSEEVAGVDGVGLGKEHVEDHRGTVVLVAQDLTPSDTVALDKDRVIGFATESGSRTSHTAIIARSLGVPAVVGVIGLMDILSGGEEILIDGESGEVIIEPGTEIKEVFQRRQRARDLRQASLGEERDELARTRDGHTIILSANIEFPSEVEQLSRLGARGVGLFRTEFAFLQRPEASEQEMSDLYRKVVVGVAPERVIFRTLDIGGDKAGSGLREPNPFLGCRGIRLSLEVRPLFRRQLRALLRASAFGPVGIMFPMVSSLSEWREASEEYYRCRSELEMEGISLGDVELGVMIEVPSAVLVARHLAREVDFFSVGTNDLVQYTLAVDRLNPRVASLYLPSHPSVMRLMRETVEAGHEGGIWVGICGELASDLLLLPAIIGMGFDEMSVAAGMIPAVKHAIRQLDRERCEELVGELLMSGTAVEVAQLCEDVAKDSYGELLESPDEDERVAAVKVYRELDS